MTGLLRKILDFLLWRTPPASVPGGSITFKASPGQGPAGQYNLSAIVSGVRIVIFGAPHILLPANNSARVGAYLRLTNETDRAVVFGGDARLEGLNALPARSTGVLTKIARARWRPAPVLGSEGGIGLS
jgi:hypothetical protein